MSLVIFIHESIDLAHILYLLFRFKRQKTIQIHVLNIINNMYVLLSLLLMKLFIV